MSLGLIKCKLFFYAMDMDFLQLNGNRTTTKHPSIGFIEDYLFSLILEWFWSRIYLSTIQCVKNLRDLVCNTAKTPKILGDHIILTVRMAVKRMSSSRQMLMFMTWKTQDTSSGAQTSFSLSVFWTTSLDVVTALLSGQCNHFVLWCLWRSRNMDGALSPRVSHCISSFLPLLVK